jgi:hypothetical protein
VVDSGIPASATVSTPVADLILPADNVAGANKLGTEDNTRKLSLNEMVSDTTCVAIDAATGDFLAYLYTDANLGSADPTTAATAFTACEDAGIAYGSGTTGDLAGPRQALLGGIDESAATDANGPFTADPERWMMEAPSTQVVLDSTEVWEVYNTTMDAHPIHVHLVRFEIVNREDLTINAAGEMTHTGTTYAPRDNELGFKDTVVAFPGQVTRLKAKFDILGRYVWHCHIVEHEDNEMMLPFDVYATTVPPTAFSVPTSTTTGNILLSWTAVAGADGYDIEESTTGVFTGTPTYTVGNVDGFEVTGKSSGTYYYQIRSTKLGYSPSNWVVGANACQFSLLKITYPVGGESFAGGTQVNITWSGLPTAASYDVWYSLNGGSGWTVAANVLAPSNNFLLNTPVAASTQCIVQIRALDEGGLVLDSNLSNTFTLTAPVIVTYPNGGQVLNGGSPTTISWRTATNAVSYDVWYSTNGGAGWTTLTNVSAPTTSYVWSMPALVTASNQCLIQVRALDGSGVLMNSDISDANFTINAPTILTYPNGGQVFNGGSLTTISWRAATNAVSYDIWYSINGGAGWVSLANVAAPSTSYAWNLPTLVAMSNQCLVQVRALNASGALMSSDVSDGVFTINAPTIITYPNGGQTFNGGSLTTISWRAATNAVSYDVWYSLNGGAGWVALANVDAPATSTVWNLPVVAATNTNCLVQVRALNGSGVLMNSDTSDAVFTIKLP